MNWDCESDVTDELLLSLTSGSVPRRALALPQAEQMAGVPPVRIGVLVAKTHALEFTSIGHMKKWPVTPVVPGLRHLYSVWNPAPV